MAAAGPSEAADPQPYAVTFTRTGNSTLDSALEASSQLQSLKGSAPASPFALIGRAQQDIGRFRTALESFGYYRARVEVTIEGHALDDPALPELLLALPADRTAAVAIAIDLGPLYTLRRITVEGDLPDIAQGALGLESGAPAIAASVVAARDRLHARLVDNGYALAVVEPPVGYEVAGENALDLVIKVDVGARYDIGQISFTGLVRVHEALVRRRLLVHSGDRYSAAKIDHARQDLLSLGVFAAVTVRNPSTPAPDGTMPLVFDVKERLRHAVTGTAAYSSDLGGSAGATWTDRNVFGNGEQLNLSGSIINLGGTASRGIGYDAGAQFVQPAFLVRDQTLQYSLRALNQNLNAYDQTSVTAGTLLSRKLSTVWTAAAGLSWSRERIIQEETTYNYTLLALPLSVKFDTTDLPNPLADPLHGIRASLSVTPTESFGALKATFVIVQGNGSTYFDLGSFAGGRPGRTVLAVRGLFGLAEGASQFSLPPDQRFYGGGSGTIRGYRYQSVGPIFTDYNPKGGTALDAAGAELRQRIGPAFGVAAFVDAGHVTATTRLLQGSLSVGVGLGLRYYTPLGPIRFDIGVPTHRQPGGDRFDLYVGLGQVF